MSTFPRLKVGEEGIYKGRMIIHVRRGVYELYKTGNGRPWVKLTKAELVSRLANCPDINVPDRP